MALCVSDFGQRQLLLPPETSLPALRAAAAAAWELAPDAFALASGAETWPFPDVPHLAVLSPATRNISLIRHSAAAVAFFRALSTTGAGLLSPLCEAPGFMDHLRQTAGHLGLARAVVALLEAHRQAAHSPLQCGCPGCRVVFHRLGAWVLQHLAARDLAAGSRQLLVDELARLLRRDRLTWLEWPWARVPPGDLRVEQLLVAVYEIEGTVAPRLLEAWVPHATAATLARVLAITAEEKLAAGATKIAWLRLHLTLYEAQAVFGRGTFVWTVLQEIADGGRRAAVLLHLLQATAFNGAYLHAVRRIPALEWAHLRTSSLSFPPEAFETLFRLCPMADTRACQTATNACKHAAAAGLCSWEAGPAP